MSEHAIGAGPERTQEIAGNVEQFVREVVVPYEQDSRRDHHNSPTDELVMEMREKAREAGVLTPHILDDGGHLSQRETAQVLIRTGLSPLGPLACNTMAPDEGNMYLLGKVGNEEIKERLYKHWDEGEIVEMLGVISLFGYLNRWNDSMGTTMEEGAIESGNQYLGKHGFEVGKHDGSQY